MNFNGKYRIQNVLTKRFLRATNNINSGSILETSEAPKAPAVFDQSYAFNVRTVTGDQARFTSSFKTLVAGVGDSGEAENSPIVWKRGGQLFEVTQVGEQDQVYNIRLTSADDLYWFDAPAAEHPAATVVLRKGNNTDQTAWRLLPIA
ncbi:hypothetical protein D9757_007952 [Collybiopsis confluens]|uniref:Uncharacterized protein n=1 Tax=Collybiopsis confluens TaxID=2823264 RepID=A0A8H5HBR9_9AGAR|nr:hypothetical protein D9757_007952 [Collybiopsis confluens]